jgi:hypothetical protein
MDANIENDQLAALIRHATIFNRPGLLRDTSAAIVRRISQPDDPFFVEMIRTVDADGVQILVSLSP